MKVCKFGGSSLASAEQIKKVCDIVMADSERKVVVVSAPGKRDDNDIKVTDLLISCAQKYIETNNADAEIEKIVERFQDIADGLGIGDDIVKVIKDDLINRLPERVEHEGKFLDSMKAAGEDNSAKIVAEYLKFLGHNAQYVNPKDAGLFLTDEFGNARVLSESDNNLKKLKAMDGIIIFPGFFGYSLSGEVVTFPRGGSDITGSILAAALEVDIYENFTDVDSVFSANPKLIQNPKPINVITYREMRELSYAGFSVLHEETLEPVYRRDIPVCIKNTNNPASPGTMIVASRKLSGDPVVGIAADTGFCSINLRKYMMNREVGFGRRVLQILEDECVSYEHIPSGIDDMSIIIKEKQLNSGKEARIVERMRNDLKVEQIDIDHDIAIVMVVGEGMLRTLGIAARATKAFSEADVNLHMINQGSSEVSMMFGVSKNDVNKSVKALYKEFF